MGSRYGLLLASGARRYCRAAIRGSCSPLLSPFPPLFVPSCPSLSLCLSRSLSTGMVAHGPREEEEEGLVGWESFDAIPRGPTITRITLAKNAFVRCRRVVLDLFLLLPTFSPMLFCPIYRRTGRALRVALKISIARNILRDLFLYENHVDIVDIQVAQNQCLTCSIKHVTS